MYLLGISWGFLLVQDRCIACTGYGISRDLLVIQKFPNVLGHLRFGTLHILRDYKGTSCKSRTAETWDTADTGDCREYPGISWDILQLRLGTLHIIYLGIIGLFYKPRTAETWDTAHYILGDYREYPTRSPGQLRLGTLHTLRVYNIIGIKSCKYRTAETWGNCICLEPIGNTLGCPASHIIG